MSKYKNNTPETMRHSIAHVLAQAVLRLFPEAKLGIGPAINNGFYYEFGLKYKPEYEDLAKIEKEMWQIVKENLSFKQITIPREQAFDTLLQLGQTFKTELLQQIPDETISFYKTGEEFIDLCRGPHVNSTSEIGYFKLIEITETNWLGDPDRPKMYRISGVAFNTKAELEKYFQKQEEMKERDHRRLGRDLKIFGQYEISSTRPTYLDYGVRLKKLITSAVVKDLKLGGFVELSSPILLDRNSLQDLGNTSYEAEQLLTEINISTQAHILRPSFKAAHVAHFKSKQRGYTELPYTTFEAGKVFINNQNHYDGLTQLTEMEVLQSFSFCQENKVTAQASKLIKQNINLLKDLGFENISLELHVPANTNGKNYIIDEDKWQRSIKCLSDAANESELKTSTVENQTRFFGPELVFVVTDSYDRAWELTTISLDLIMPKLLEVNYATASSGSESAAILQVDYFGSIDMLISLMIEEYGGAFPTWIAPVQAVIISISEKYNEHVNQIRKTLRENGIRSEVDTSNETLKAKIRDAQLLQIPFMLIIGEKEVSTSSVSVRPRSGQDVGLMRLDEFIQNMKEINQERIEK